LNNKWVLFCLAVRISTELNDGRSNGKATVAGAQRGTGNGVEHTSELHEAEKNNCSAGEIAQPPS